MELFGSSSLLKDYCKAYLEETTFAVWDLKHKPDTYPWEDSCVPQLVTLFIIYNLKAPPFQVPLSLITPYEILCFVTSLHLSEKDTLQTYVQTVFHIKRRVFKSHVQWQFLFFMLCGRNYLWSFRVANNLTNIVKLRYLSPRNRIKLLPLLFSSALPWWCPSFKYV